MSEQYMPAHFLHISRKAKIQKNPNYHLNGKRDFYIDMLYSAKKCRTKNIVIILLQEPLPQKQLPQPQEPLQEPQQELRQQEHSLLQPLQAP